MSLGIVRNGPGIVGDISLEFARYLTEGLQARVVALDDIEVIDQPVDVGYRFTDVAVPEIPLDLGEVGFDLFRGFLVMVLQTFGVLVNPNKGTRRPTGFCTLI